MGDDVEQKVGSDTAPAFESSGDEELSGENTSVQGASAEGDAPPEEGEAGAKIVKICKKCMTSQTGEGEFCGRCGAELVPIRAVRESYVGEVVGEKYKIVDRLGSGGMGEVYLGLNEPLGQRVAVKFLGKKFTADEGIIMRFLNEARSYCKVNHPNAVTLLEYGQHDDGALYLITEFIEGDSLSDTLRKVGPFGLDHVISVATQVCEVLSAAHGQGVIHRDLKPDNIMVMPTGRGRYAAKVLDFGIAKIVDDDHQHGPMTETGSVFGTPEFMSPEQCRGDEADPRSDLYAMGIILFYMATGKLPFKGKNKLIILNKQLHDKPPRPSMAREDIDVPHRLESVILKCLNKDPEQRYQSADDLLEALEEAASAKDAKAVQGSETERLVQSDAGAGDSPEETRSQPPVGGVADIHGSETVRRDLSNTMNTDPETAAEVELGAFDDSAGTGSGLDEVDLPGEWAERDSVSYDEPRRWKPVAAVIVALLVLGGIVWGLGSGNDDARDVPAGAESGQDELAAADGAAVDLEIDRVLVTGQVLGSLAAAEDNLEHGDLAAARRGLETTYMWLDDDQLSESARERRTALADKLDHLEAQRKAKKQRAEQQAAEKREAAKRAAEKRKEEKRQAARRNAERQEAEKREAERQKAARQEEKQKEQERKAAEEKAAKEKEKLEKQAAQAEQDAQEEVEKKDEQDDEPEEEGALPPRRLD